MENTNRTVLIMAGGTGGHVFPALAIAELLREQGIKVYWLGTKRGIEATKVPAAGFPICYVSAYGVRRKGIMQKIMALTYMFWATLQAIYFIIKLKPNVGLGMGGYVAAPGSIALRLFRIPLIIHEQNAIFGLTNRLLAHIAQRVLTAFPEVKLAPASANMVGNPVRAKVKALFNASTKDIEQDSNKINLLIVGGSQGALFINQLIPKVVANLRADIDLEILHQTGEKLYSDVVSAYQQEKITADVKPFIDDVAAAYEWADLVICRAGAMTVTEVMVAGVPAIFIPYPYAVDNHQLYNALGMQQVGAAIVQQQNEIVPAEFANLLWALLQDRNRLKQMSLAGKEIAQPNADASIVAYILPFLDKESVVKSNES